MSLHKAKPTSAGRRFVVEVKTDGLYKGKPYEALVDKKSSKGGRNNNGRITVRHRGGGHKQRYRMIDFKRDKDGIPGVVERLEYDPNRSAHIALVKYVDGERRYILAPKGVREGAPITEDVIWSCTTCRACESICPLHIQHLDFILEMRKRLVLMESRFPEELQETFNNLENQFNPWGFAAQKRADWCRGLELYPKRSQEAPSWPEY